jgi:hypothetical protein
LELIDFDLDTARTLVGATFNIELPQPPPLDLRVTAVREMSDQHARVKRTPFRVEMLGNRLVPQGIYPFRHEAFGGEPLDFFIVATGKTDAGYEYEMIFA